MKKYNCFNLKWFALWSIAIILAFFVGMNGVYAYFTASAKELSGSITTATVMINSGTLTVGVADESEPVNVTAGKLVPGDSVGVSATIENIGNADIYVIVKLVEEITLSGASSPESTTTKWYNLSAVEIDTSLASATVGATPISSGNSGAFSIGYELEGDSYGNTYKNATVSFTLYVYALQYKNISSATAATQLILDSFNK